MESFYQFINFFLEEALEPSWWRTEGLRLQKDVRKVKETNKILHSST
jgi:hypothetical protein